MTQWNDYAGGAIPEGTTHVQLPDGSVAPWVFGEQIPFTPIRYFGPTPAPVVTEVPVIEPISDYVGVAHAAFAALLAGTHVMITHPAGYSRCGFPLPATQVKTGQLERPYRPSGVLEWIEARLKK